MELPVVFVPLNRVDHWNWIKRRASPVLCEDTKGIVALRGEKVLAIAAFDSWSHNACLAHIAVESPMVLRHGFLGEVARYVFETCGRNLMLGLTPANNDEALRFNRKVGMREVYRIPGGYQEDIDYVLQEMRKDECRWLKDVSRTNHTVLSPGSGSRATETSGATERTVQAA